MPIPIVQAPYSFVPTISSVMRPLLTLVSFCLVLLFSPLSEAGESTAQIVYFSSPQCPFCTVVAEEDLAPLEQQHGEALEILTVDTTTELGEESLRKLWLERDVPSTRRGVPGIVIGDQLLVGTDEISKQLPDLIDHHLQRGGVGWPDIAGLDELLEADASPAVGDTATDDWRNRLHRDVPGNYVSTTLLVILLLCAVAMIPARRWQQRLSEKTPFGLKVGVAGIGFAVALYLAYGETTRQDLFCGPVGQCNIVQHSDMAMLFGVLPLAVLGALAYGTLLALYLFRRYHSSKWTHLTPTATLVLTLCGFGFSILLTFWQPFVIGATCSWCLISAMTMTACCLFNLGEGRRQIGELRDRGIGAVVDSQPEREKQPPRQSQRAQVPFRDHRNDR